MTGVGAGGGGGMKNITKYKTLSTNNTTAGSRTKVHKKLAKQQKPRHNITALTSKNIDNKNRMQKMLLSRETNMSLDRTVETIVTKETNIFLSPLLQP